MVGVCIAVVLAQGSMDVFGGDVGVRVSRNPDGTLVESYLAKDVKGKMRVILASPTANGLALMGKPRTSPLLQTGSDGLFESAPTFGFTEWKQSQMGDAKQIELTAKADGHIIVKRIKVPAKGHLVTVSVTCDFQRENPVIRYLLDTYAFAPDGKPMRAYGKPDATFLPGIRPRKDGVVGDHFFRSPIATAQKGELAVTVMPDLDVLKDNRYMPTILDLDAANGVVDAPLISYGFADYKLVGHVYYTNDSSMTKPVPPQLLLAHEILLDAQAEPFGAYQKAAKYQWDRYGHRYFDKVLSQAMPFEEYAKVCIPAALNEEETGGWFEHELNGHIVGGMPSGWGRMEGWVSWQPWFNQLRSAWGMRWWGKRLGEKDWVEKADKMLNLALAAPMDRGAVPTTYLSKTKGWKGSLITPDPRCYYDLTNMAWKGIWMLRWLDFEDCPRRDEILRQCREMAKLMVSKQNRDGSIPTWLDKDLNVVPVLDRSAQTALPVWFLVDLVDFESALILNEHDAAVAKSSANDLSESQLTSLKTDIAQIQVRIASLNKGMEQIAAGADFLAGEVVNGQYWYDYETFFSCSPKTCFQRDGQHNHEKMRDPHTLQAPQNTLSMHWTAEALQRSASVLRVRTARFHQLEKATVGYSYSKWRAAALKALDTMVLSQNVWPISYRKAAYTYGGFGVQNSDGEYNDARQAQFGDTLCDFGAALGRQDYFERGVASIRASMALINHPKHIELGIYPNPNYPLGLQPENTGHGGTDQQNGRTGPDWGELSGLTSMAYLLHTYGRAYVHRDGWTVGIDGVAVGPEGRLGVPVRIADHLPRKHREVKNPTGSENRDVWIKPGPLMEGSLGYDANDGSVGLSIMMAGCGEGDTGDFVNASGQRIKASVGTFGASDRGGYAVVQKVDRSFLNGAIHFEGKVGGWPVKTDPEFYFMDPTFDMKDWRMPGWAFNGDFLHWPVRNPRNFNWNNDGLPFIGTCENGRGGFDDEFTGTIESPWFLITKPTIRLKVGGGAGNGVYVELLSGEGAPPANPKQVSIARGKNRETMDDVVWDVSKYKGQHLKIRIVDQEKGGWGHINVGNIRCE